ncbi:MAG: phosphoglycerate mutase [Acidimicrobiaceae bacterium]|nr:phosphoglycerate mutase [Acidimicrobiaceae bacterium]|tara:strand:- start:503 stop:1156 length:654 start_codon:yes stop_codon:yes gene_type:complete
MSSKKRDKSVSIIILVRHGHTPTTGKILPGRAKGLHLSELGKEQASKVATNLSMLDNVTAVYASPMERTLETAKPIASAFGLKVQRNRGLIEADFGKWTGRKLSDLRKLSDWEIVQKNPSLFRFPDGESFIEIQSRMVETITRISDKHRGEIVIAVSHADTIKAFLTAMLGTPLDLFQRLHISPCSVSPVILGNGSPFVLAVNASGANIPSLLGGNQ